MQAKALNNYITLTSAYCHEGVQWAEVYCADYEGFRSLPSVIEVNGMILGKIAWNSDKFYATYNSRALIARVL
jgi:vancomycin permeability regulator SanA